MAMNRRGILAVILLTVLVPTCQNILAQDQHYTQFQAVPLIINPAFTGQFDGKMRASANYRSQWASVTVPFKAYHLSVDATVLKTGSIGYIGLGGYINNGVAGDGNLRNFSTAASIAYHVTPGNNRDKKNDLSIGLQGEYAQSTIDLARLYFNAQAAQQFITGTGVGYPLSIGNSASRYVLNSGISFSHSGGGFSYQLGAGINNINQPGNAFDKKVSSMLGFDTRYTLMAGCDISLNDVFSVRPALIYSSSPDISSLFSGTELSLLLPVKDSAASLFIGAWYRTHSTASFTAGLRFSRFGCSIAYDFPTGNITASEGRGGLELSVRYILMGKQPNRVVKTRF